MNKHHNTLELNKILAMLAQKCACDDARELAMSLVPESNLHLAQALLNQTADAHALLARFGGPPFGGLVSVNHALARAHAGGVLSLRELLNVAQLLRVFRGLASWRDNNAGVATCLDALFGGIHPNKHLEESISTVVLNEHDIADHASPTLADIRRKMRQKEAAVRARLEQITRSGSYAKFLQEAIVTQRGGRFVVPVKAEHRADIPGLVHDASASGATLFIEPMGVVEANNEVKVLKGREREEIDRIITELSSLAGSFSEAIAMSYACAVDLNVIFAKANLGYDMKASVPELNDRGEILLRRARHPLINKDKVVPIDVSLGVDFDALVITGPNTGGKTVSLKTLGLLSLMAMCGLLLPVADQSRISVFTQVLADIGDEQSIEQSLSTFSSHMTNIVSILATADPHSLVLIDELGAGTDPVEGAALAMAIIDRLRQQGARLAATTHYAELKAYALQTPGVENGSCEFDVQTLRPTYRLLIGVPGRSNAFAIGESLGLPVEIIERAQRLVNREDAEFEDVIAQLQARQSKADQALLEAEAAKLAAEQALEKAQQAEVESQAKQQKILDDARAQAQKIADKARREAYALVNELDKLKKQADAANAAETARKAKKVLNQGLDELSDTANEELDLDAARAKLAHMGLKAGSRDESKKAKRTGDRELAAVDSTRLDLRGLMVDECILELERFIDQALRTSLREFTVVHGKGTGALRSAVQKYLKDCKHVQSHRLGVFGEGEHGVTIVTMK
ncbi:MAG: Smr/MutS family protein [Oscillospiraceae bacterium]|nr:Smr/MutS family protein [Oscillospiraceae bacterium]